RSLFINFTRSGTRRRVSSHLANVERLSPRLRWRVAQDHLVHRRRRFSCERNGWIHHPSERQSYRRGTISVATGFDRARRVLRSSRHRHTLVWTHASGAVSTEVSGAARSDRARTICSSELKLHTIFQPRLEWLWREFAATVFR